MKRSIRLCSMLIMACVLVAAAAPLEALTVDPFNAIGSGTSFTTDCTPASASCSATFSGRVRASQAGNFLVSATLTINHSAGFVCIDAACTNQCFGASGTGTLNNPKGDSIAFGEAGLLCSIAPTFVPETFSGTYFIEGGTGTFANEIGSGVATASVNGSTIATVPLVLFSLNGTIGTN